MSNASNQSSRLCFVVGPIGDDESDDRIHADWLLEEIIEPVFNNGFSDFRVERADKIATPGRIDAQVITALLDAELVIADLTSLNPNAFYEIGIRHMVQKPVIHMHLEGQRIPFDIASFRSIKFSRTRPKDIRAAREALRAAVEQATDEQHSVDNPVTYARGKIEIEQKATPAEKIIEREFSALRARISNIENTIAGPDRDHNYDELIKRQPPPYSELLKNIKQRNVFIKHKNGPITAIQEKSLRRILNDHFNKYSIMAANEKDKIILVIEDLGEKTLDDVRKLARELRSSDSPFYVV